jgi:AraC-like DNA-binding protein
VRHEIGAGQYFIVPPDTYHVTSTEKGVYRNCIHFDWQKSRSSLGRPIFLFHPDRPDKAAITPCPFSIPQEDFIGSFQHIVPIASLIETLFHRWHSGEQISRALCQATLLEILILLMSRPKTNNRPPSRSVEQAYAVRDLLDQQSDSKDGIQSLLKSLGFSYPHLCRIFRTAFGITPVEYRNAMRLERAKALLPNLKLTIAEIAYEVGFTDPGYFTRQFRKQNGVSPNTLREHLIRP